MNMENGDIFIDQDGLVGAYRSEIPVDRRIQLPLLALNEYIQ